VPLRNAPIASVNRAGISSRMRIHHRTPPRAARAAVIVGIDLTARVAHRVFADFRTPRGYTNTWPETRANTYAGARPRKLCGPWSSPEPRTLRMQMGPTVARGAN
jgi:hypothetical protein